MGLMLGGWVYNVLDSAIVISLIPLPRHEINHMKIVPIKAQIEVCTLLFQNETSVNALREAIL